MSSSPAVCQVMEKISNVAVLITHSSTASSSSSSLSALGSLSQSQTQQTVKEDASHCFQQKQADDSLIQVIEKLSKIVEKRPQRRCTFGGHKRGLPLTTSAAGEEIEEGSTGRSGASSFKKIKNNCKVEGGLDDRVTDGTLSSPVSGDSNNNNIASTVAEVTGNTSSTDHKRTVTCYQCSLCPYLSQTLPLLKEHLKQHNEQHSDLILMCSECHFTSRDQGELEAHVRLHFENGGNLKSKSTYLDTYRRGKGEFLKKQDGNGTGNHCSTGVEVVNSIENPPQEVPQKKKWYSYEEYGLYRCLICSYVCSQQRMLKTHAWKHAGLVDCSYPIFEDEDMGSARREVQLSNNAASREEIVVLSPVLQDKSMQELPTAYKLQLCMPVAVENKQEVLNLPISKSSNTAEEEEENVYPVKDVTSEEPMVEVQVTTETESEGDIDHHDNTSTTDSLLSSAQKIINSSPNSAGHINVIVERLPSAEDSVMTTNPLLLSEDVDRDKRVLGAKKEEPDHVGSVKDVVVLDCSVDDISDSQPLAAESSVDKSSDSPRDENIPPAGRKRTHSESLRLHSLAAEALVAMPMRTPELPTSSTKVSLKTQTQNPQQKLSEVTTAGQKSSNVGTAAALLKVELHSDGREEDLVPLALGEEDEVEPATKAGISLSLLTVIERLRERSDQNASDEDILKELQDNAQFQNGAIAGVVTGNGAGNYMCSLPGMDGLVGSPDGGLVDYIPGNERPYRCRLCRYSSGNKGYIKQHLRVHKQRQPYQCPICEHIASDSKDLENHMIHHCKTRTYQCKQCPEAFHYKVSRCHSSLFSQLFVFVVICNHFIK